MIVLITIIMLVIHRGLFLCKIPSLYMQVDHHLPEKRRGTGKIHQPQCHHHVFDALLLCHAHQKMHTF